MKSFVKFLLLITLCLYLGSCDRLRGKSGSDGNSCSFSKEVDRTIVHCTDGSSTVIMDGIQGQSGLDGEDGEDAESCTVSIILGVTTITCPNGTSATVLDGVNGTNGTNGIDGEDGIQGPPGINGVDGAQGPKGDTGAEGPKGDTGDVGPAGPPGTTGPQGAPGPTGAQGPIGPSYAPVATIIQFPTNGLCKPINDYYVKRASNSLEFYPNVNCTGSRILKTDKVIQLSSLPLSILYVAFMLNSPSILTATIITF